MASVMTAAVDALVVVLGVAIATAACCGETADALSGGRTITAVLAATLFFGGFERIGGYSFNRLRETRWQTTHALGVWAATVFGLLLVGFAVSSSGIYSRAWALSWISMVPAGLVARGCLVSFLLRARGLSGSFARNVAIIGTGAEAQHLIGKLRQSAPAGLVVRGVIGDGQAPLPAPICGVHVLGTTDELSRSTRARGIDELIIALPLTAERRLRELSDSLREIAIDVHLSLEPVAKIFKAGTAGDSSGVWLLTVIEKPFKGWRALIKWTEDMILALFFIVLFGPLMIVLAILIKLDSRGPVLFTQARFGLNNEVINVLKFRTMHVDRGDPSGAARTVRDDPRVTRCGRILRRFSLDELPQLINVLRGDMSVVGPRPHAVKMTVCGHPYGEAVDRYRHRHRVKPGITGWAQVTGFRGEVDTLEKARARVLHDLDYIENWSLWLDVKILLKTAAIVLSGESAW
jgi:Undecaprenyl-phosphate glucose phosphotransferase